MIYRAIWMIVSGLLRLALPLLEWRDHDKATWVRGRLDPTPITFQPKLWVHAVSVGEARVAVNLIRSWDPQLRRATLATATTTTGLTMLQRAIDIRQTHLLPFDRPTLYRQMLGAFDVPNLIVIETELWPGLIQFIGASGGKIAIVNGRISSKTLRWSWVPLLRNTLAKIDHLLVRNQRDVGGFLRMGATPQAVVQVGNLKYDYRPPDPPTGRFGAWLQTQQKLIIFASVSTDEIPILAPLAIDLLRSQGDVSLLWAPRHIEDTASHLTALGSVDCGLRSQIDASRPRAMVLDTLGELAACYSYARLAVVGGSFNRRGGQNFIEALIAGTPAITGPSLENFRVEAEDAKRAGALVSVASAKELGLQLTALITNSDALEAISAAAEEFVAQQRGALARTNRLLLDLQVLIPSRKETQ